MIKKYYNSIQLILCITTVSLLFWFTLPYIFSRGGPVITSSVRKMADEAIKETEVAVPSAPVPATPSSGGFNLAGKEKQHMPRPVAEPIVVKVEKTWAEDVATVAHSIEIFSPLSSLFISIYLWRQRKREDKSLKQKEV
jgi:hypothetical protein